MSYQVNSKALLPGQKQELLQVGSQNSSNMDEMDEIRFEVS